MKTSNKYIALAAMALTFAACTQEEDFTPQTDGDAVKINVTIVFVCHTGLKSADGGVDLHSIAISLRSEVFLLCTSSEGQRHGCKDDIFI